MKILMFLKAGKAAVYSEMLDQEIVLIIYQQPGDATLLLHLQNAAQTWDNPHSTPAYSNG